MQTGLRQALPAPDAPGHLDSGPGLQLGPESVQFSAIERRDAKDEDTEDGLVIPDPCVNFGLDLIRAVGGIIGSGTPVALPPAVLLSGLD